MLQGRGQLRFQHQSSTCQNVGNAFRRPLWARQPTRSAREAWRAQPPTARPGHAARAAASSDPAAAAESATTASSPATPQEVFPPTAADGGTLYLRTPLAPAQAVRHAGGSVCIVGDVPRGASIEAGGDIIILGSLEGRAAATAPGAMVAALGWGKDATVAVGGIQAQQVWCWVQCSGILGCW
jgi:septum formation inhibitor MinC